MMINCLDCGACCKYLFVPLPDHYLTPDVISWLEMHPGLKVRGRDLHIKIPCSNLLPDNKCAIYESRPQLCRDFRKEGIDCIKSRLLLKIGGGS